MLFLPMLDRTGFGLVLTSRANEEIVMALKEKAAVFPTSGDSGAITGQTIVIHCGLHITFQSGK